MELINRIRKLKLVGMRNATNLIMKRFLFGRGFVFFERFGIHVLPVHYYSPIPDTRYLRKNLHQWYKESPLTGIDMHLDEQLELLNNLQKFQSECDKLPTHAEVRAKGLGEGYGEVESHFLYSMLRYLKPSNVIEVGSGMSTYFSVNALSMNKMKDGRNSTIYCIDPYVRPALKKLKGECQIEIIPTFVQDIGVGFFGKLNDSDVLFIDSSHIVKIGSDVNYLYLEVLPNLRKRVVIHIHDIPFPFPTPNPKYWIFGGHQFWTESSLLQAFLVFNSAFNILLCQSCLHYKKPQVLASAFKIYDNQRHFPSSIWLQKVK